MKIGDESKERLQHHMHTFIKQKMKQFSHNYYINILDVYGSILCLALPKCVVEKFKLLRALTLTPSNSSGETVLKPNKHVFFWNLLLCL